jgi:hypothetical protein
MERLTRAASVSPESRPRLDRSDFAAGAGVGRVRRRSLPVEDITAQRYQEPFIWWVRYKEP